MKMTDTAEVKYDAEGTITINEMPIEIGHQGDTSYIELPEGFDYVISEGTYLIAIIKGGRP